MSDKTLIAWTDATWNPVRGCSRVSEGCRNCYAEVVAARFSGPGQPYEGLATRAPARWTGVVREVPERLYDPLRWQRPRRVFVNSMSDLFHESLPDEAIARVFTVMARARQHTFQVLTKRPKRMRDWVASHQELLGIVLWPLQNVWLGVSVEDQRTADERIPLLLQTPAAVRFVSAEPLLGPVDLRAELGTILEDGECYYGCEPRLDWVIVGGESGPGARPCDVAWVRSLVAQCRAAGVACFVKQLGANPAPLVVEAGAVRERLWLTDRKGGDPSEWPEDLRVREFPKESACPQ